MARFAWLCDYCAKEFPDKTQAEFCEESHGYSFRLEQVQYLGEDIPSSMIVNIFRGDKLIKVATYDLKDSHEPPEPLFTKLDHSKVGANRA